MLRKKSDKKFYYLIYLFVFLTARVVFCEDSLAKQDTVDIEFDNGMVGIIAEDVYLDEILSKISDKTGLKIQVHGEIPKEKISCKIKNLVIEDVLRRLFYRWDYILLKEEDKSINMWLTGERKELVSNQPATDNIEAVEGITVSKEIPKSSKGRRKKLLGIF